MPTTNFIKVEYVFQDLNNLRNVPQKDEKSAMKALIAVNPDYFYGLMDSIIESGYLPLESIVVIQHGANNFTVREGNRRIAILKILLGISCKLSQLMAQRTWPMPPSYRNVMCLKLATERERRPKKR